MFFLLFLLAQKNNLMKYKLLLLLSFLVLFSCKKEDDSNDDNTDPFESQWAMTAKIDNHNFKANTIFGDHKAMANTIFSTYPRSEYFRLAATEIPNGNILESIEINIWLKKDDLHTGTFDVGLDSDSYMLGNQHRHHIDLIDGTNDANGVVYEYTLSGQIKITDLDTVAKKIKGTFEFIAVDSYDVNANIVARVTNGTFNYDYSEIPD